MEVYIELGRCTAVDAFSSSSSPPRRSLIRRCAFTNWLPTSRARYYLVGNKIRDDADLAFIGSMAGIPLVGYFPHDDRCQRRRP